MPSFAPWAPRYGTWTRWHGIRCGYWPCYRFQRALGLAVVAAVRRVGVVHRAAPVLPFVVPPVQRRWWLTNAAIRV